MFDPSNPIFTSLSGEHPVDDLKRLFDDGWKDLDVLGRHGSPIHFVLSHLYDHDTRRTLLTMLLDHGAKPDSLSEYRFVLDEACLVDIQNVPDMFITHFDDVSLFKRLDVTADDIIFRSLEGVRSLVQTAICCRIKILW